jgi:glutamine synthetase
VKPKAVLAYCREKGIKSFDLRFADVLGTWRHITFPVSALTEASFEEGFGHDIVLDPTNDQGPTHSILVPQGVANYLEPFTRQPTLVLIASIQDTVMREESSLDSRHVAVQAMRYLESSAIGDGLTVRACCQFQVEQTSSLKQNQPNAGSTFLACGPQDSHFQMRCDVTDIAAEAGLQIERHFSGLNSSSEMILKPSSLVECCDDILMLRYLLSQTAANQNEHISTIDLWLASQWSITRQGESIFVGSSHRGLSETGLHAIGGILRHVDAITAIAVANDASFVKVPWLRLCSAEVARSICRVIVASNNPRDKAIEFRGAPAACNPYLVFSAVLMAMIDGIQNKASPGSAMDKRFERADEASHYSIGNNNAEPSGRRHLMESLMSDCDFLSRGEVFSNELLDLLCRQLS